MKSKKRMSLPAPICGITIHTAESAATKPETEVIDKLFLELSQFVSAETDKERRLKYQAARYGAALVAISEGCVDPRGTATQALDPSLFDRRFK